MRTFNQVNSDYEKAKNDIEMTDRQAFSLNAKYAEGKISHEVLVKSLDGMQKYREKLFKELVKYADELAEYGFDVMLDYDVILDN